MKDKTPTRNSGLVEFVEIKDTVINLGTMSKTLRNSTRLINLKKQKKVRD